MYRSPTGSASTELLSGFQHRAHDRITASATTSCGAGFPMEVGQGPISCTCRDVLCQSVLRRCPETTLLEPGRTESWELQGAPLP